MSRGKQRRFGFGCARRAWNWAHRGSQTDKIEPFALKSFGGPSQPLPTLAVWTAVQRKFDQARITPVERAQQVDEIRQVAASVRSDRLVEGVDVRMTRAALGGDPFKLRFGNADRLLIDSPGHRHALLRLRCFIAHVFGETVLIEGRKDEVYAAVRKR